MAKELNKINVNLAFTADTSKAKAQMKELQETLNKIANTKINDNLDLKEAGEAAKQLSYHLGQAFNATTGNIDLSKLNHSLQKSSTNVTELSNKLLKAGATGQQAFIGLAKSISTADYPMFKLNSKLSEMITTLKNAARWQLSSSMLHGFMGAVNQAYGYVQNLNESLTNISIVTGKNIDQMANFAEEANRAAKALSSTTTDYTNASLIYYQQGLDEEEVLKRTDVTVKMANVAGKSAAEVSDQLTAVWNNFAKTGDNLEYYADVMTALGAATASSTDEIAGGLEKFAAIADTIGLSYEYAASALATITSNTRQSEEVVGTALKTIFARIQGLNLGETLDDGTTLNKYSAALESVGIAIFDQAGELKNMDTILDEMGEKWNTLSVAQQTALAQTVAGVRQYNQLISLMENWSAGDSDSMMANLETAYNATGALQEQADIWGKSWEAASNRVKTSAQGVYDSLLDDKLFINFNNVFADMLTGVEEVVDGVGGLKGLIITTASFFVSLLSNRIQPALTSFVLNVKSMFQSAQAQAAELVGQTQGKMLTEINSGNYSTADKQQLVNASTLAEARTRLTVVSKNLTDQEKELYQTDISLMEMQSQKAQVIADQISQLEKQAGMLIISADATDANTEANRAYNSLLKEQQELSREASEKFRTGEATTSDYETYFEAERAISELQSRKIELNETINDSTSILLAEYEAMVRSGEGVENFEVSTKEAIKPWQELMNELRKIPDGKSLDSYKSSLEMIYKSMPSIVRETSGMKKALKNAFESSGPESFKQALNEIKSAMGRAKIDGKDLAKVIQEMNPKSFKELEVVLKQIKKEESELKSVNDQLVASLNNFNPSHMISGLEKITSLAASIGSIAMMGNSISSMIDSWNNEDLSFGEKLSTSLMSVSMLIPGVISSFKGLNTVIQGTVIQEKLLNTSFFLTSRSSEIASAKTLLLTKSKQELLKKENQEIITKGLIVNALKTEGHALDKNTQATIKEYLASEMANGATKEDIANRLVSKFGIDAETASKIANKLATDALKTSVMGLIWPIGLVIAAVTGLITVFKLQEKEQQKIIENDRKMAERNAEKAEEIAKANREEFESYKELYKQYIEHKNLLDDSQESKDNLRNTTDELCKALGVEWDALDRLQGKYEEVNKEIAQVTKNNIIKGINTTKNEIGTKTHNLALQSLNMEKNNAANTTIWGVGYSGGTWDDYNDEIFINDELDKQLQNQGLKKSSGIIYKDNEYKFAEGDYYFQNASLKLIGDSINNDTFLKTYQAIQDAVDSINNDKNISDTQKAKSEVFQGFLDFLDENKESYNEILELQNSLRDYGTQLAQVEAELSSLDMANIESFEEYEKYKEKYKETLRSTFETEGLIPEDVTNVEEYFDNLAETYLNGYEHIYDITQTQKAKESVAKEARLGGIFAEAGATSKKDIKQITAEKIDELYNEYGEIIFDGRIEWDKVGTEENLINLLEKLKSEKELGVFQIKIETVREAQGKLKEGMSQTDYDTFKTESGIDWGNKEDGIIEWTEFLQKTYTEQVKYLNDIESKYNEEYIETIDKSIQDADNLFTQYKAELDELNSKTDLTVKDLERKEWLEGFTVELENYIGLLKGYKQVANGILLDSFNAFEDVSSLDEYYAKLQQLKDSGINTSFEEQGAVLSKIAGQYSNCKEEVEKYNQALLAWNNDKTQFNKDNLIQAKDALELAISIGEQAEAFELSAEEIENYSKRLKQSGEYSRLSEKETAKLAVSNLRLDRGLLSLNENIEDYNKSLKTNSKDSAEWSKTMDDVKGDLADILNIGDASMLSDQFAEDILKSDDLKKALNGDADAIMRLRTLAADDIIINIVTNQSETETPEQIKSRWEQLKADFEAIDINAPGVDQSKLIESFNQMIVAGKMTKDQIESALTGLHVSANVKTEYVSQTTSVPQTVTEEYLDTNGTGTVLQPDGEGNWIETEVPLTKKYTKTYNAGMVNVQGYIPKYTIEGTEGEGNITTAFTELPKPKASVDSTSDGGAGKKSTTKNTGPKKSVKPERYKEINDRLDDASNAYEKASKAVDRFYGPKQIAKMREANKELSKEISLLNVKQKQAKDYLNDDREALEKASADLGLKVNIDDNNFITNYTDLMNQADKKLKDAYASAGDTIDDEQQEVLDALEKKVEDFEAAIAQFDETRETLEDIENEVLDKIYERQDRNFEILNKELEIKIDIDDRALDRLEYYADKFSDNFYKLAETYALIFKGVNDEGVGKIDLVKDKLAQYAGTVNGNGKVIYGDYMRDLEAKYHNEDISQDKYVEGLKNAETNIRDALTELNAYDKEMFGAYENTLDEASSTIEDHVDHIEHLSGVFDHYLTLMEMFGKQKDYTAMNNFLGGKVDTIRDRLDIAKEYYETLKETNNAGEYWQKYQDALESGNEDDINWWKQQWDAEIDALDAAQEEMLSLTEEWAEARRAVIENHIAEAADALEKSLTNGYGFEFLNDEWDKMNTRQEEYLDNVNKVYETNKLMRTAQKALDETDNKVAKQKLKGFIDETQHLQENTNLSEHELEIQQAKYDLLLAEIALEEAQNAKSVVRLSRDNEGNFGYVYTADQDKVADAQQGVDDKRNDLYNLTLEGQKEYTEKYLQASQEMYDELNVLQEDYLNGLITEDEFKIRSESIKKYYQGSFEFQNEMSALEQAYRNGEIKNEEEYNLKQQEILNKYQAEDWGILNQYLYLASVSNRLAKEEDRILQNEYNSGSIEDEKAYNKEKEKLISTFASNSTGILGDFLSFYKGESEDVNDKVADHWDNGLDFISHNTSEWVVDIDRYLNEVEDEVKDWADTYEDANEDVGNALKDSSRATEDLTDESEELKKQIQNKVIPAVQKEIKAVRDLTSEYGNQRAELLRLIETYEDYLDKLSQTIDTESGKEEKPEETPPPATDDTNSKKNGGQITSYNNDNSSAIAKKKSDALDLLDKAWRPGLGTDSRGWKKAAESGDYGVWGQSVINLVYDALSHSKYTDKNGNSNYDYEKAKNYINSYDTGGYTGIWGPEGKLAFLHEKEIVLNKDDTENLLKTVSFIRELVSMIDSQASMSSLFNMTATTGIMTGNAGMEQQITIYADFPDATDHNEIEMAFNTLLNTASQYANRK